MNPEIILLSDTGGSDKNLIKFLNYFKIRYVTANNSEDVEHLIDHWGIKSLGSSLRIFRNYKEIEERLYAKLSSIFLYEAGVEESPVLSSVSITGNSKSICREFSGLSFVPQNSTVTVLNRHDEYSETLISINHKAPMFATRQVNGCRIFLSSTDIADIEQKISGKLKGRDYFLQIVPVAMYMRYAFEKFIEQRNTHYACIIVDDPLLKEEYGFLNFRNLLNLMDANNFFTTIGFIPWNYKRTDRKIAELFKARRDRLSICVHGCDHTRGEFSSSDPTYLDNKIRLATARMIEHEKITGVPFDRAMVFPQGIFSSESMEALKRNNYLAAVNTEPIPVNPSVHLTLADYLGTQIMKYSDFPLFLRRSLEDMIDIAFDLFWGRPAFIVTHHNDLKDGCRGLVKFVNELNRLSERIKWEGLGKIITRFIACKESSPFEEEIRLCGLKPDSGKTNLKISMRRHASEFRDNYLAKHKLLLSISKKMIKLLRR